MFRTAAARLRGRVSGREQIGVDAVRIERNGRLPVVLRQRDERLASPTWCRGIDDLTDLFGVRPHLVCRTTGPGFGLRVLALLVAVFVSTDQRALPPEQRMV